jgi:hypothetical protein
MQMMEYKYTIVHKDGSLHADADALSHYPLAEGSGNEVTDNAACALEVNVVTQSDRAELQEGQRRKWLHVFKNQEQGKETANYTIRDGLTLRESILKACHDDITAGHLGRTRTYDKVQQRYFWSSLVGDVERYVRACRECHAKKKGVKPRGFMELSHVEKPWDRTGIDILEPFPLSRKGNRYIVVAVDNVTKWAEAVALPVAGAMEVADFFVHEILLRHGAQRSLTTDQGECFVVRIMQRILQVLQTNHRTTTAYHQQANGQVERLNHTFTDMLSMYVSSDHSDWDAALPYVRFAYNTSRQETTGRLPFF